MKIYRVAILFQLPLIGRAIEEVLKANDDIEVVACVPDEPGAWSQLLQLQPDVVIRIAEDGLLSPTFPALLPEGTLRFIHLGTTGNEMRLFQARQMTVTGVEDLLQAIRFSQEQAAVT